MVPVNHGSQLPADTLPHSLLGMGMARRVAAPTPSEPIPFPEKPSIQEEAISLEPQLRHWILREHPSLRPDLDDVIQETFFRFIRASEKNPIRCIRTYLFGIARHVACTAHRRHKKNPAVSISELPVESALFVGEDDLVRAINHQQQLALTLEAIQALPDRCREIVVLHTVEGLSYQQIAGRLGVAEQTVRVQMSRAVKKCVARLRETGGPNP